MTALRSAVESRGPVHGAHIAALLFIATATTVGIPPISAIFERPKELDCRRIDGLADTTFFVAIDSAELWLGLVSTPADIALTNRAAPFAVRLEQNISVCAREAEVKLSAQLLLLAQRAATKLAKCLAYSGLP